MRKKKSLFLMLLLMMTGTLMACGNDASGEQTTITYALWDDRQAVIYQQLADKFEEETGIHVAFEHTPWAQYWTKIETTITGGNAPDVFWINLPRVPDYIENGVLHPLDGIQFDEENFPAQFLEAYTVDGVLYAMPKDFDSYALYFNKTMFDEAGLDHPDETWTWDDWKEAARVLTNPEEGVFGMAAPVSWQGGYYEMIFKNGGKPFIDGGTASGFADEKAIEALEFWFSFVEEGLSPSVQEMAETSIMQLLTGGRVAMGMLGSFHTAAVFENEFAMEHIDLAPLPKGELRATTSNSVGHVISASSENVEASLKWIEFLSTREAMEFVANAGVVIPIYRGTQDGWVNSIPEKNLQVHVDALEYAFPLPSYLNASAATAIEAEILNRAWTGEITVREASLEVARRANEILQGN